MDNVIYLDEHRKKILDYTVRCVICCEKFKDENYRRGQIPSGRLKNEYILIGSCNKCFHTIIKKRMYDSDFWNWIYKERELFESLPPLDESETESG